MIRIRRARRYFTRVLAVGLLCPAAAMPAEQATVGRHVADLLRESQSAGLRIIFTDRIVPADLRVTQEPRSHQPLERLREVLRPHALKLDEVVAGTYVVTREPLAEPPRVPEPPQEVHISASRYTIAPLADAPFGLDSAQIDRQPALFDDATRSIRRFPGTAGQDLSSRTFVRGGTPDDNLVLLDGVPLYEPFHLPGLPINFSVLDPAVVGRVDFYSGVLPMEYGNRMGALVNMSLREPGQDFGGRLALSALAGSALVSGPLADERGDWLAFGRRGLLGQLTRMDSRELGRPNLLDGLARVRYRLDDGARVTLGVLAASDTAHIRVDDGSLFENDSSGRRYLWAAYDRAGERLQSRTLLAQTSVDTNRVGELRDTVGSYGSLDDDRHFSATLLKQDWSLGSKGRGAIRWGISLREERAHFDFNRVLSFDQDVAKFFYRPPDSAARFDDTVSLHEKEAYWDVTRTFGTHLSFNAGVHWNNARYSTQQTSSAWDPRVSLRFDVTRATRLRYSFGRMTQVWAAAELPVEQDRYRFDEPSTNTLHVLAMEHDFGSRVAVRGEVFDKRIARPRPRSENAFFPHAFLPELRADRLVFAPESSRMQGFDLYATVAFSERISGWLSYSRSIALDNLGGSWQTPRAWDQPHSGGLGLAFAGRATRISAEVFSHHNWPLTPILFGTQTLPDGSQRSHLIFGARDPVGQGIFLSLNLKGERTFDFESGSLRVALEVTNATNRRNDCCDEVTFFRGGDGSGEFVGEGFDHRYWLPITPYASIAWEF